VLPCDSAVAHPAWINVNDEPIETWPDERLDAELARVDDVPHRVAGEPASGHLDLSAKAKLLRYDWEAALGGHELHSGERALLTLLKEVSACA
jgi:hypothetical protein